MCEWSERIIREGKRETTLEIAEKLKDEGADFNLISKATGLSVEEIEKL